MAIPAIALTPSIDSNFWCGRVKSCFELFAKNPQSLHHLLLYGPPGSGKTTAAHWLVDQIWGNYRPLMCMSMNAADERSLDSIRQKALPFFRMDWRINEFVDKKLPRFLIMDECETLTEPAQMSLTNILDSPPTDFCLIIICNSQSKIHPKLRNRLLKIRFDPPNLKLSENQTIADEITRGDLRFSKNMSFRKNNMNMRLWELINPSIKYDTIDDLNLSADRIDITQSLTELILLSYSLNIVSEEDIQKFNSIYILIEKSITDAYYIGLFKDLVKDLRPKIEKLFGD